MDICLYCELRCDRCRSLPIKFSKRHKMELGGSLAFKIGESDMGFTAFGELYMHACA